MVYSTGQIVSYNDEVYQCIQGHTSEANWMPPAVPALWKDLGPCGSTPTVIAPTPVVMYPNPATGDTTTLSLPGPGPANVTVEIFTLSMREVRTIRVQQASGSLEVRLYDKGGMPLANGLYYFRVTVGGSVRILKLLVLR